MLSTHAFDDKNARLLYHFHEFFENKNADLVHCYLSIQKNKEVNTWPLIELIKSMGAKVVISRSELKSNDLTHYLFEDYGQLKESSWGIPEPQHGVEMEAESVDIVLVPLIVFDKKGHRIGYGKGYYDKFLSECREDCLKVGLSLSPPLDLIPYTESHDISLDFCVTPHGTYSFNQ